MFNVKISSFIRIFHRQEEEQVRVKAITPAHMWIVKESFQSILVDNVEYCLLEVVFSKDSLNMFTSILPELSMCNVLVNIQKEPIEEVHNSLSRKISLLEEENINLMKKGFHSTSFISKDISRVTKAIEWASGYIYVPFITCRLLVLRKDQQKVTRILSHLSKIQVTPLLFDQLSAFKEFFLSEPRDRGELAMYTAACNPFCIKVDDSHGIFIGREERSHIPVFEDFFLHESFHSVIIAKSGAGKSYLAKMLARRMLTAGIRVIILDPEGEYTQFVEGFKGVSLDDAGVSIIDGWMMQNNELEYIKNMLPILSKKQGQLEEKLLRLNSLEEIAEEVRKSDSPVAQRIAEVYKRKGTRRHILENHLLHFHLADEEGFALVLYKIVSFALQRSEIKTMIIIDEAHKFLDKKEVSQYIRQLAKRGRKYNVGIIIISQDLIDIMQHPWNEAVLTNATCKFFLRQEAIAIPLIEKVFNLQGYSSSLSRASVGSGLFISNGVARKIHFDDI